jgi:predicted phage tail protein
MSDTVSEMSGENHQSALMKALSVVPGALSSKPHIIFLVLLGVYLVLLPLFQVHVSAFAELVGGNYTNVTSDLGACIAAGGTIHVMRSHKAHRQEIAELKEMVKGLVAKLDDNKP